MRGAKVLWGRAHESAGAPPYWPWVQAIRDYRDQTATRYATTPVRAVRGGTTAHLPRAARAVPEPARASVDSEEGQFRLFDALSSFLRAVSLETPLVIVLDDLHWADSATLRC